MTVNEFREHIITIAARFVKKYRPATLNIQCPLRVIVEHRQERYPGWQEYTCKACRRINFVNFNNIFGDGSKGRKCLIHPECDIYDEHPACPDFWK